MQEPFWRWVLPERGAYRLQLGPLDLWVDRAPGELRVVSAAARPALDDTVTPPQPAEPPSDDQLEHRRFVGIPEEALAVGVATGDLPFVVRPLSPWAVLARSTAVVWVSTPVWVTLAVAGRGAPFFEAPTLRPSKTWFGPTPQAGEVAYAARTSARADLEGMPRVRTRALTRVTLDNRSDEPWWVERLKVPLPQLALFGGDDLWTSTVRFQRQSDEIAEVLVGGPPEQASGVERLTQPRQAGAPTMFVRAFGRWGGMGA